ncbi:MAG: TonB-dependent receptor [Planctomycetes bacterium]|nr:TonB-dependent receptor [Planctomycetota bacterium]
MLCLLLLSSINVKVKSDDKQEEKVGKTKVVTPSRIPQDSFESPRAITIIDETRLDRRNALSIIDNLNEFAGVWAEKRTATTGDPVMRGLSGSNLLALVDGNTLSTFWGEGGFAGDDMYGKVDADSIEKIEIVRGPSSVLWGSNALGGIINFITRSSPYDYTITGWKIGGRSKWVYGSAADEIRLRQEVYGASPDLKFILGGSGRDVNDVVGGRGVGLQKPSGGEDRNFDFKGQFRISQDQELELSAQYINRTHVRRFYKPLEDNFNDRNAASLAYKLKDLGNLVNTAELKLYHQDKIDRRRFFSSGNRGKATTLTNSAGLQLGTKINDHKLTYGTQYQIDKGESADDEQFTITYPNGSKKKASPNTKWIDNGFYLQDEYDVSQSFTLTSALRYDRYAFESSVDEFYQPPGVWDPALDDFTDRKYSLIGSLGILYRASKTVHLVANYGRGYRLWPPKFGATQHGYGVVVPTMGFLEPVTGDTYEVGVKLRDEKINGSGFIYYTDFDHYQVTEPGLFQGSDWFDFDGDGIRDSNETVYVVNDSGNAYVYGLELESEVRADLITDSIGKEWSFKTGFMWNYGRITDTEQPLRHTVPAKGILGLRWEDNQIKSAPWAEFVTEIVGKFSKHRIPDDRLLNDPGYRSNPQNLQSPLIRSDGHLPGSTTYHLRCGLNLSHSITLTIAVENITNKKYRRAHSRWDEPGTNFLAGVTAVY